MKVVLIFVMSAVTLTVGISLNGERWTVKQMESQKKKLEEQLKSLSDESRKDDLITFDSIGETINCGMAIMETI